MDYLQKLNDQQRQAVTSPDSCIVIAGPGTGKTHTLTSRIQYLLQEQQIPENQIIALTFTKKAAQEMKTRVETRDDSTPSIGLRLRGRSDSRSSGQVSLTTSLASLQAPFIGTIHSWCYHFLKTHHPDWQPNPKQIISEAEQKRVLKEYKSSESKIDDLLSTLSLWKQGLLTETTDYIQLTFQLYQQYLNQHHLVDFDDLLINTHQLLAESVNGQLSDVNCSYLLVDEFQDLNRLQFNIILQLLNLTKAHIFAVGDPRQSIYGFRGASPEYLDALTQSLSFKKTHHNLHSRHSGEQKASPESGFWTSQDDNKQAIILIDNYRSGQQILDTAEQLFPESRNLQAKQQLSCQLEIINTPDHLTEAYWISQTVQGLTGAGEQLGFQTIVETRDLASLQQLRFSDIAILYRTHSLANTLKQQLEKDAIPFQVVGEISFLEYPEVMKIIQILEDLTRVEKQSKPFQQLSKPTLTLSELTDDLIVKFKLDTSSARSERLRRLKAFTYQFGSQVIDFVHPTLITDFLTELKQLQAIDEYQKNLDKVTLATIHAAKGLEFTAVFIIGVEGNLLPFTRRDVRSYVSTSVDEIHESRLREDPDEERRLFYVGLTRAKQYLYLTQTKSRFFQGQTIQTKPSVFLEKIKSNFTTIDDPYAGKYLLQREKKRQEKRQMKLF